MKNQTSRQSGIFATATTTTKLKEKMWLTCKVELRTTYMQSRTRNTQNIGNWNFVLCATRLQNPSRQKIYKHHSGPPALANPKQHGSAL